jgi:peroxiredoxin
MAEDPRAAAIEIGSPAPDFELPGTDGGNIRLSSFRGSRNVMLIFYPLDWSPVCSNQLPAIQADQARFDSYDTQLLGISVDSRWSHDAFARSLGLKYPLLSDMHREVARKYGMLREKENISERALVVLDKKGVVRYRQVFEIGKLPSHEEALRVLQSLSP